MKKWVKLFLILCLTQACSAVVGDGLVFEMDASLPGDDPYNYWRPVVGPANAGVLRDYTDPAMGQVSHRPFLVVEPGHYSGFAEGEYVWFYRFSYSDAVAGVHDGGGGLVGNLGDEVIFDYDKDYTVDFWFRYPRSASSAVSGKGWLFSVDNGSGFRFNTRTMADGSGYFFELVHIYDSYTNSYNLASGMPAMQFDNEWHYAAVVHDGTTGQLPAAQLWIDGEMVLNQTVPCFYNAGRGGSCPPDFSMFNTLPEPYANSPAAIGGRCDYWATYRPNQRFWWAGDLAILRVYDRVLSADELQQNFAGSIQTERGFRCGETVGDLNGDCYVDLADFAVMCQNWLMTNWID